jgi:hypothetical protein
LAELTVATGPFDLSQPASGSQEESATPETTEERNPSTVVRRIGAEHTRSFIRDRANAAKSSSRRVGSGNHGANISRRSTQPSTGISGPAQNVQKRPTFVPGAQEAEVANDKSEDISDEVFLKERAAIVQRFRDKGDIPADISDEEVMALIGEDDDDPITIPDDDDDKLSTEDFLRGYLDAPSDDHIEEDPSDDYLEGVSQDDYEAENRDRISDYVAVHPFGPPPKVSDAEKAMLAQLSDSNIKNLTPEQIAEIAGKLDLVNEDGSLRDPTIYPYSRNDWPQQMASNAKRLRDYADALTDTPADEQAEMEKLEKAIHPSDISSAHLPYIPHEHKTEELRLDWPNTPLSTTGLTESVMQKVTFMAQRLPHGHWTPSQIAARYEEGYMVRFESEAEKATVLELAAQLANERAQTAMETGESVQVQQMGFRSLAEGERGAEAKGIVEKMVRGVYAGEGKQSRAFLDGVVRMLGNNESYDGEDTRRFVGRVEALIGRISRRADAGAEGGESGRK